MITSLQISQMLLTGCSIRGYLKNFTAMKISGKMKSFLLSRSLKVIIYSHDSEVYQINAGVRHGSLIYLHYINDLPIESLRSSANIYAVCTTVYGCNSNKQDEQNLRANLPSVLTLTNQQKQNWGVIINKKRNKINPKKLVAFRHHQFFLNSHKSQ